LGRTVGTALPRARARPADGGPHPLTTLEWSPGETVDDHLLITPPDHLAHNM